MLGPVFENLVEILLNGAPLGYETDIGERGFEEATALCGGISRSLLNKLPRLNFFAAGAGGGFPNARYSLV